MYVVIANPLTDQCDVCNGPLRVGDTFFDAAVPGPPYFGTWGWVCSKCAKERGVQTGPGVGQEYNSKTNEKVRG